MEKDSKQKINEASGELKNKAATLQNMIDSIEKDRKTQEAIQNRILKGKMRRVTVLAAGIVIAVLIAGISINNLYQSGAEERSFNSKMDAIIDTAEKYLEDQNYDEAIEILKGIPENAKQYSDAGYYTVKAQEGKEDKYLENAAAKAEAADYQGAISVCDEAVAELGEGERLTEQREAYLELYRKDILSRAESLKETADYQGAVDLLKAGAETLESYGQSEAAEELNQGITAVGEQYQQSILSEAKAKSEAGAYEEAAKLLTAGAETLNAYGQPEAAEKLNEEISLAGEQYQQSVLSEAKAKSEAGAYEEAAELLKTGAETLNTYGQSGTAEALNEEISSVWAQYKQSVLSEAKAKSEAGAYEEAEGILAKADELFPKDSDVKEALNQVQEAEILSRIASYEEAGDDEGLLRYLSEEISGSAALSDEVSAKKQAAIERYSKSAVETAATMGEEGDYEGALAYLEEASALTGKNEQLTVEKNLLSSARIIKDGFVGSMNQEEQMDEYPFTAPITGVYRFDMTNSNVNTRIWMVVASANQEELASANVYNGDGISVNLKADNNYYLRLYYGDGTADYSVKLGIPKEVTVLENLDEKVSGEIRYIGQRDVYTFTISLSGRYRFQLFDDNANANYNLYVTDSRNNQILSQNLSGGEGVTLDLEEGETYELVLEQRESFASYEIGFGTPRAEEAIDNTVNEVSGSLTYTSQMDRFTYETPLTGRYRLDISDDNAEAEYYLYVFDYRRNVIASHDYIRGGEGLTLDLEGGQTYSIELTQRSGTSNYTLSMGVPQDVQELSSDEDSFSGTFSYVDQVDQYRFTVSPAGQYEFCYVIGGQADTNLHLYVKDSRGTIVLDTYLNQADSARVELDAGETYTAFAAQNHGFGMYVMSFQKYVEEQ